MTGRDRMALGVVAAVVGIALYWFLLLAPKRHEAAAVKTKVTAAEQRLAAAKQLLAASQAARVSYAANYTAVSRLGKAVPADDDVPSLVYQLDNTSKSVGADFRAIKVNTAPYPGAPTAPAAPTTPHPAAAPGAEPAPGGQQATPVSNPAGGGAPNATATATPASSPATQAAIANLPPGALVGPAGLATMPFSFEFQGSFSQLATFFGRVERYVTAGRGRLAVSGRFLTLNGVSVTFTERGFPHMRGMIAATAYILPPGQGVLNGASPSAPAQNAPQPVSNPGGAPAPTPPPATATLP